MKLVPVSQDLTFSDFYWDIHKKGGFQGIQDDEPCRAH
jgi:hypothetical protein